MHRATGYPVLIRAFRLNLTIEGLRPRTIQNYVRDVERFTRSLNGKSPRSTAISHIRAYVLELQDRCAAKTVNEAQLALRRFFRFLVIEGEIGHDPTKDVKLVRYRVDPQPTYTELEVKRLLRACDASSLEGLRNKAMLMVLFDTGVREGELVSMGVPDWERSVVQVDGKTGVRQIYLGTAALQAVERYVRRWKVADPLHS